MRGSIAIGIPVVFPQYDSVARSILNRNAQTRLYYHLQHHIRNYTHAMQRKTSPCSLMTDCHSCFPAMPSQPPLFGSPNFVLAVERIHPSSVPPPHPHLSSISLRCWNQHFLPFFLGLSLASPLFPSPFCPFIPLSPRSVLFSRRHPKKDEEGDPHSTTDQNEHSYQKNTQNYYTHQHAGSLHPFTPTSRNIRVAKAWLAIDCRSLSDFPDLAPSQSPLFATI